MTTITTPFGARATAAEVLAGVDLTGRRVIVTGGASGLGAETVRALATAGAHVTIATRTPAHAKQLVEEFPRVDVAALDLADLGSVRAFCAQWKKPVDALVANAGVMALPEREVIAEGWEMHLGINFLGHFALVTGLWDALRSGGGARIVVLSSGAHLLTDFSFADPHFERRPYDPLVAYGQSKTASVLLAVGISRRWAGEGIYANACAPGVIRTNLLRHLAPDALRLLGALDADGNAITPAYFKTPEQGAATPTLLAVSPLLDGVTGRYFEDNQESPVIDGGAHLAAGGVDAMAGVARWALDPVAADRLWDYASAAVR
ncbi:SDR family NAD(P)-dependent oxidoreductase [Amycolatopsis carbonis]|uniref:Probable oxidoreductase n=1 Tax=Amycolatopsis carbonis TaxID=715471 RepID=A0A9Y2IN71_9PSEU|nr:SDR family NAD(P)-dependent oxidoreductase [Amycolatopsis sp. 2-15]WIX82230.1 SDR family NAD(P)-dependent oxidoreductase [Amycolatopsis sp. 2-15]